MVQPLEQKKRQGILIWILVIVAIITAIVWYTNYQKKPSIEEGLITPEEGEPVAGPSISEERLKEIELDFSVLDNSLFKSLKSHGALPVTAGETGRENPFEPY